MPRTHPLIGLTTYGRSADNRYALPAEYVDAVRRAGGVPLLIAPGETCVDIVLQTVDATVVTGGGDSAPGAYGGRRHPANYGVDLERDALEVNLARRIAASSLPTLGICRGAQILNVAHGGTLIEYLRDELGEQVLHRASSPEPIAHGIRLPAPWRLAQLLGKVEVEAASCYPLHSSRKCIKAPSRCGNPLTGKKLNLLSVRDVLNARRWGQVGRRRTAATLLE